MAERNPRKSVDILDLSTLVETAKQIKKGALEGLNGTLRHSLQDLKESPNRDEVKEWVDSVELGIAADFIDAAKRKEKKKILRQRKDRLKYFEGVEIDPGKEESAKIESVATQLSLSEVSYYDSHFNFSNNSVQLFKIDEVRGPAKEVRSADGLIDAEENFIDAVQTSEFADDMFAEATGSEPAPILGSLENSPVPRFVWIEDLEHIYIEFWSVIEDPESVFDGQQGVSLEYKPRIRTAVRLHLDSGLVEFAGGKDNDDHKTMILQQLLDLCSSHEVASDGGQTARRRVQSLQRYTQSISEDDMWNVIQNLGVISTLEAFKKRRADVRLSAVKNRNVQESENYDDVRGDAIRLANIQVFIDEPNGRCEFISPDYVESTFDLHEDATREEIQQRIKDENKYPDAEHITVSLNKDENTVRIQKERWGPTARRSVFHLVADELN